MITIDDPEIERLARDLAARDGESVEESIRRALRLRRERTPHLTAMVVDTSALVA